MIDVHEARKISKETLLKNVDAVLMDFINDAIIKACGSLPLALDGEVTINKKELPDGCEFTDELCQLLVLYGYTVTIVQTGYCIIGWVK